MQFTIKYRGCSCVYDNNGNVTEEAISSSPPGQTLSFRTRAYSYDSRYDGQDAVITQYYYDDAGNILRMYTGLDPGNGWHSRGF